LNAGAAMNSFPNISRAIALLVLVYIIQLFIAIAGAALGLVTPSPSMDNPLTLAFFNTASIGIVLLIGLKLTRASFSEVFRLVTIPAALLFPMSLTVIGMSMVLSEVDNLLRTVLPVPTWLVEILQNLFGAPENFWGSLLTLVVVAPLTEELLFRGLILRGFLGNYPVRKAIVVSALLFGAFHLNPWQFSGAVVLGAIFAWWFVKTRSLFPCLFGHALNNGLPLILLAFPKIKISGYSNEITERVTFQPLWFDTVGVLLAGIGMWWLHREFMKMNAERSRESSALSSAAPAFSDNARMEDPQ
jgi:membrane protease YdiL (CAAX protease family)